MKFVTYKGDLGNRVGVMDGDRVYDAGFDGDMVSFIEAGAPVGNRTLVKNARLQAPLRPRSLRDFITFEDHLKTSYERLGLSIPKEWYQVPVYYKGMPETVIGPGTDIPWPSYSNYLDCELELGAVIGRQGSNIAAGDAEDFIFGYTIWNDVSARDVQRVEMPVGLGPGKAKDWDGSNVLGPCIVTADELDPQNLRMILRVNGEVWTEDTSGNMHYSIAELIAYASLDQTLYPGEIFGSGTPSGGSGIDAGRRFKENDLVELEIAGIGILQNHVGSRT